MVNQLRELQRKLNEDGASRSLVQSFESLVGATVITKDININKFTVNGSNIFKNNLGCAIVESIETHSSEKVVYTHTANDVLLLCKNYSNKMENLVKTLKYLQSGLNKDFWDRVFNEKYAIRYGDNDDFVNVAEDFSIYRALFGGYDYVSALLNLSDTNTETKWRFDHIQNKMEKLATNHEYDVLNQGYYPLLNMILSKSFPKSWSSGIYDNLFNLEHFTMRSMYEIIVVNGETIIEGLEHVMNDLKRKKDDYYRGTRNFDLYSHKENDEVYHNLMNVKGLLDDDISLTFLEIFECFVNNK